jgi:dihydrofolate reductase
MGKVMFDISMSLDGLIAGPHPHPSQPLGKGGERLHAWAFEGKTEKNNALVFEEMVQTSGAIVAGRGTYELSNWGEKDPWGSQLPVFVLTHAVPAGMPKAGAVYTFVTEGLESALHAAKAAAGEKNVCVIGGANIGQQCLQAGLLDEIHLHLVSILLGEGIRLFEHLGPLPFELQQSRVVESRGVTHIKYRVVK